MEQRNVYGQTWMRIQKHSLAFATFGVEGLEIKEDEVRRLL